MHTILWDNCLLNNCGLEFVNIISLWQLGIDYFIHSCN